VTAGSASDSGRVRCRSTTAPSSGRCHSCACAAEGVVGRQEGGLVSRVDHHAGRARGDARIEEQVEIAEVPDLVGGVEEGGEGRPFEHDGLHPGVRECADEVCSLDPLDER
jgi:hypothetical protein